MRKLTVLCALTGLMLGACGMTALAEVTVQVSANPASWTNAPAVSIEFSATGASGGDPSFCLSVDSSAWTCSVSSPYSLDVSALADGEHSVCVRATDGDGNVNTACTTVYVDTTPPNVLADAIPSSWSSTPILIWSMAWDDASGVCKYEWKLDGLPWGIGADTLTIDPATLADGPHSVGVRVTDCAANRSPELYRTIYADTSKPLVQLAKATQDGGLTNLLNGGYAIQGTVTITVIASDGPSGLKAIPTVTVTPQGNAPLDITATGTNAGADTFTYTWQVTPATPDGTMALHAAAADRAGNTASADASFNVSKNQAKGTIELEALNPGPSGLTRNVNFRAYDASDALLATWDVPVYFAPHSTKGEFVLLNVPAETVWLSAKTNWNLRHGAAVTFGPLGLGIVNLVGPDKLLGGDLSGDNAVNIQDYSILAGSWYTKNPVADINGDGEVTLADYILMRLHFFATGDPK